MPTGYPLHAHAVHRLDTVTAAHLEGLADVLVDCVEGGASVSFMHPLPAPRAPAFWREVADAAVRGGALASRLLPQGGFCDTTVFYRVLPARTATIAAN